MKNLSIYFLCLLFLSFFEAKAQRTEIIPMGTGLTVTWDNYQKTDRLPVIIFCHQAGWSRGEYREIAPKVSAWGFTCMAVDLRSGGEVNGVVNETAARAKKQGLPTSYLDTEPDIIKAIDFFHVNYGRPVILWGSSYSASMVLKIGAADERVKAVVAFSPGEYFGDKLNLKEAIKGITKPVFVTSSKKESTELAALISDIKGPNTIHFIPSGEGEHGSRALWEEKADHQEYWDAIKRFLYSKIR